ncbi:hypothetical protein LCGC14_2223320 [marine sediment metagenome]|uniref:UspA domain-containing protein n=1 Tax=marine sediment metagenome TaxID=412755 RepID=A0A0F9DAD1_9ZZZZ
MLATDGSPHAKNALKQAIEFQKLYKCNVVIIHSIKDNRLPSELYPNVETLYLKHTSFEDLYKEAGEKLLKSTKEMFGENESFVETRLIEDETPQDYIKRIVGEENFDLVILGSQGQHSKIKKVLGTVSSKVAKKIECDVLIVK